MLRDLFVIRVFGGHKLRHKRLADITPDDMMLVYKRQMLFVVVAIVSMILLCFIVGKDYESSRNSLAGNPNAYKYMTVSEYMSLPGVKSQVDKVAMREDELYKMLRVPDQSPEYYDNVLKELEKCRLEYKRIRNQGGFE